MLLCGDVAPTKMSMEGFEKCDLKAMFSDVLDEFAKEEKIVVNLECAITETDGKIKKCGPWLKAPLVTAKALKMAGVTDCGISNNHIFDYGSQGMLDTMKALDEAGINWTGAGMNEQDARKNLFIETCGKKIAIVAVSEHEYCYALEDRMGARVFDPYETIEDIRSAKEVADYVVVMYHGAKEYCTVPSPRVRKLCQAMIRNGANLVMTQHSHCVGCHEQYMGGEIVYGMGNFCFVRAADEGIPLSFNTGMMLRLDVENDYAISFIPVTASETGIRLANEEEKANILAGFEEVSKSLHNGEWLKIWREFCESLSDRYCNVLKHAVVPRENEDQIYLFPGWSRQSFAHFLDCEAHTDVWRELFKTWNHTNN